MSTRRWLPSKRAARWLVCGWLVVALPLCGLATLLSSALGAVHFHQPAAVVAVDASAPMTGWSDFRRANHIADSGVRLHDHAKLGRHHHDANDASRVTVGAGENDDGVDGAAATTPIVLAVADTLSLQLPMAPAVGAAWTAAGACSFDSCDARRRDRPPTA